LGTTVVDVKNDVSVCERRRGLVVDPIFEDVAVGNEGVLAAQLMHLERVWKSQRRGYG
jgi:hypothetical protein